MPDDRPDSRPECCPDASPDAWPNAWIDTRLLPSLDGGERLLLFGAGQGSLDLMDYLARRVPGVKLCAVADNDSSMWGKSLQGAPIIAPKDILATPRSCVVVTTVSGREAVAAQLTDMGLVEGRDFHCVGRYPDAAVTNLATLAELHESYPFLRKGARALHVGPGGFLGLECCLQAMGLETVSTDAYAFGMHYPDVTPRWEDYQRLFERVCEAPPQALSDLWPVACREALHALFCEREGHVLIDKERVPHLYPHRLGELPLLDEAVDIALSFAVLEHVRRPQRAVQELHRVLRPGGVAVQRIITRDHRSFSAVQGYSPISHLACSEEQWQGICADKFPQNRVTPAAWRRLFEAAGFQVAFYRELERCTPDAAELEAAQRHNPGLCEEELCAVNCDIVAIRRG